MNVLRETDAKHEQKKWDAMSPAEKTIAFVMHQRWWLLTWLMIPVALPNWCIYTLYLNWLNRKAKKGIVHRISLAGQRAHIPSIICGAALWYVIIDFYVKSFHLIMLWLQ